MLHECIGSMSYKEQYWEHFACSVSKKESKEKVADMLMPEIIGYKVREQVCNQEQAQIMISTFIRFILEYQGLQRFDLIAIDLI